MAVLNDYTRLKAYNKPIQEALHGYYRMSDGQVEFDPEQAVKLEQTRDKPYRARSESAIRVNGRVATSKLVTIVFGPRDGTGNESLLSMKNVTFGDDLRKPDEKMLPRSKNAIHTEAHLAFASMYKGLEGVNRSILFAGNLTMFGAREKKIHKIAELGQDSASYVKAMDSPSVRQEPIVTLTTGFHGGLYDHTEGNRQRFGDPHSVFNEWDPIVQVAGFIAVREDNLEDLEILRALGAEEPYIKPGL